MKGNLLTLSCARPANFPEFNVREWEAFLGQARQARLLARLASNFYYQGWTPQLPDGPRAHLESSLRLADRQQHEVRWEVYCIRRALGHLRMPVVLLKGAAYVMADLPPARGRLFSDVDIMVPHQHLDTTESALFAAGWISDERDKYNQRYYRRWMHEIPPLRHVHRNNFIDLHHTITPPTSRFKVEGKKLLNRVLPIPGYEGLFMLAPADMVLHSAVHLFQEGEFSHGLRDLLDMNDLLLHFAARNEFWEDLLDRADELGLQIPLFHAFFHRRRLLDESAPLHLMPRIRNMGPNVFSRVAMGWMLGLALQPIHPTCDTPLTGLARWLLYVRSHILRMPIHLVVPHLIRKAWMRRFASESM